MSNLMKWHRRQDRRKIQHGKLVFVYDVTEFVPLNFLISIRHVLLMPQYAGRFYPLNDQTPPINPFTHHIYYLLHWITWIIIVLQKNKQFETMVVHKISLMRSQCNIYGIMYLINTTYDMLTMNETIMLLYLSLSIYIKNLYLLIHSCFRKANQTCYIDFFSFE